DEEEQRAAQREQLLRLLVAAHPLADGALAVEPLPQLARTGADPEVLRRRPLALDAAHPLRHQLLQPPPHPLHRQPGHAGTQDLERVEPEWKRLALVHAPAVVAVVAALPRENVDDLVAHQSRQVAEYLEGAQQAEPDQRVAELALKARQDGQR